MILRILLLACTVVGTYSLSGMLTPLEFRKFESMCFQKDDTAPFRINGQENPLASSMKNFISLAEKFEAANPNVRLKEELFYFLRNYTYENIQLTTDGIVSWSINNAEFSEISKLWEPEYSYRNQQQQQQQQLNDPFSDDEKCSLYFMISHSIVDKAKDPMEARSMGNTSSSRTYRTDLNIDDYYPQEIGVVAVRGSEEAVSLSRVLVGLYVGLNQNRKKEITSFDRIIEWNNPEANFPTDTMVDPLYSLTLAEVLMLSAWIGSNRKGITLDGHWVSSYKGIESFCPMVYKQNFDKFAYSSSSVRGAADGLILGTIVHSIVSKQTNTKLSQLLRMYYSLEGIAVEQGTSEFIKDPRVSFCNRQDIIKPFTETLETQMLLYGFLVASDYEAEKRFTAAKQLYDSTKDVIYPRNNKDLQNYCGQSLSFDTVENLPRETFLDVIVVMDTVTDVAFQMQQKITGYLANYLDLRYTASRISIFLDQRITIDPSSPRVDLKPIVLDEYSSSCAACKVGQILYEKSTIEKDQIVLAIDNFLEERKANESKLNGANGKVVLFFNFESDGRNNRVQGRLEKTLRDFFTRHRSVHVYAVGLETEILKKFARNDPTSVFLSADGNEQEVAEKLYEKISRDPGLLQYSDCRDGAGENSAVYEGFVSPYGIQHWEMPAEYFYKSKRLIVTFESQSGLIKVCHNRATMRPENEDKSCNISRGEFKLSNPCQSVTKETCSPFYFAVMGMKSNGDTSRQTDKFCSDLTDKWCPKLDSVKFKVSHDGVRCSGCLGLGAAPMAILLAIMLSYILHRMF